MHADYVIGCPDCQKSTLAPIACRDCRGTGIYRAGWTRDGKHNGTEVCYRCQGAGRQSVADQKRNYGYDMYAIRYADIR